MAIGALHEERDRSAAARVSRALQAYLSRAATPRGQRRAHRRGMRREKVNKLPLQGETHAVACRPDGDPRRRILLPMPNVPHPFRVLAVDPDNEVVAISADEAKRLARAELAKAKRDDWSISHVRAA